MAVDLRCPLPAQKEYSPADELLAELDALSDLESDWEEADTNEPSPPQCQAQAKPQPYTPGLLMIEEVLPAGFNGNGMTDIMDGDEDQYNNGGDVDGEGDRECVVIGVDNLMDEMDKQLQSEGGGGEPEGERTPIDLNRMDDFLARKGKFGDQSMRESPETFKVTESTKSDKGWLKLHESALIFDNIVKHLFYFFSCPFSPFMSLFHLFPDFQKPCPQLYNSLNRGSITFGRGKNKVIVVLLKATKAKFLLS